MTHRNCVVEKSRGTGTLEGLVGWTYGDRGRGIVNIYLDSRPNSGCTSLRIRYEGTVRSEPNRVYTACKGANKNVAEELNTQYLPYGEGRFIVDWCDGVKGSLVRCIPVWSQRVDETR